MTEPTNKETDLLPELPAADIAVLVTELRFTVGKDYERALARRVYQRGARDYAAMANSWITHRTPRLADASTDGMVIIPVGNGSTTAAIDYNLVVPDQPWAPFNAKPGKF